MELQFSLANIMSSETINKISAITKLSTTNPKSSTIPNNVLSNKEDLTQNLSFYTHPFLVLYYSFKYISKYSGRYISNLLDNKLVLRTIFIILGINILALKYPDFTFSKSLLSANKLISWYGYWVILGVLSSIGLGAGLHTFMLFLGPFVAKVTFLAYECSNTNFFVNGPNAFKCMDMLDKSTISPEYSKGTNLFFPILTKIFLPSLFWGAGTALGELPPYFLARTASATTSANVSSGESSKSKLELENKSKRRKSSEKKSKNGKTHEEITTLNDQYTTSTLKDSNINNNSNSNSSGNGSGTLGGISSLKENTMELINTILKRFGFIGILIFASIPNPLFDFAGIACGHFGIPFWTFFGATFLGKALIKSTIQSSVVIFIFSKNANGDGILDKSILIFENRFPSIYSKLSAFIDAQRTAIIGSSHTPEPISSPIPNNTAAVEADSGLTNLNPSISANNVLGLAWNSIIIIMLVYFVVSILETFAQSYLQELRVVDDESNDNSSGDINSS